MVSVKLLSAQPPLAARLHLDGAGGCEVVLAEPAFGVAAGQACVFYDAGEGQARVLGGGFIKSAVAAADYQRASDERMATPVMRG